MTKNLIFTKVAKVLAAISVAVGLVGVVLGMDGFSGGQSLPGTQAWEAVPSIFLGVGCSLLVSGTIIGVLCEISQNIAAMSGRNFGGGGDAEVPPSVTRYERASDPWDAT